MECDTDIESLNEYSDVNYQDIKKFCRKLLNKINKIADSDDVSLDTINELNELIQKLIEIESLPNINKTAVAYQVLSKISSVLIKCISYLNITSLTYDPKEFCKMIFDYINNNASVEDNNILGLSNIANDLIPQNPMFTSIYGAFDINNSPQPKSRKEIERRTNQRVEKKEPEKVVNVETSTSSPDNIADNLFKILKNEYNKNRIPINYYDYIIDTDSFGNTIENMFHFAFLVNEGRVHVNLNNNFSPLIKPCKDQEIEKFKNEGGKNFQLIGCMDMKTWRKYKKPGLIQLNKINK